MAEAFRRLTPHDVVPLVASLGLPAGPVTDYESLENRVYGFGPPDGPGVVVKLYRPGRWSSDALREEVAFVDDLANAGVAVLPTRPGTARPGTWRGIHYVVLDRVDGDRTTMEDRELLAPDEVRALGEQLAVMHEVGQATIATHRPTWSPQPVLEGNLRFLEQARAIPDEVLTELREVVEALCAVCVTRFEGVPMLRIHGDLGLNNVLWPAGRPVVMDFDDFTMGPAEQDLLTLAFGYQIEGDPATAPVRLTAESGNDDWNRSLAVRRQVRSYLLEGYRRRRPLDDDESLVEPLLFMRLLWFDAWRWARRDDPGFAEVRSQLPTVTAWRRRIEDFRRRLGRMTTQSA